MKTLKTMVSPSAIADMHRRPIDTNNPASYAQISEATNEKCSVSVIPTSTRRATQEMKRRMKTSNGALTKKVFPVAGAITFLRMAGFDVAVDDKGIIA